MQRTCVGWPARSVRSLRYHGTVLCLADSAPNFTANRSLVAPPPSGICYFAPNILFVEDNREGIVLQSSFFCLALTERQLANAVDGRLFTLDAVELERPAKIKCGTMLLAADGAGFARPRFRGLSSESGLHDLAFLSRTAIRASQRQAFEEDRSGTSTMILRKLVLCN